ncbi:hypothetical protein ANN_11547 [Periplaneta americana]|uniref:Uncharacterized protein n=1 Tax=Periplaneta americana TaxID=6978 RepID=A0ABQ8T5B7_PERAM|nr:hypothetical protein ANN_11547 [Periplaneta americana]
MTGLCESGHERSGSLRAIFNSTFKLDATLDLIDQSFPTGRLVTLEQAFPLGEEAKRNNQSRAQSCGGS